MWLTLSLLPFTYQSADLSSPSARHVCRLSGLSLWRSSANTLPQDLGIAAAPGWHPGISEVQPWEQSGLSRSQPGSGINRTLNSLSEDGDEWRRHDGKNNCCFSHMRSESVIWDLGCVDVVWSQPEKQLSSLGLLSFQQVAQKCPMLSNYR